MSVESRTISIPILSKGGSTDKTTACTRVEEQIKPISAIKMESGTISIPMLHKGGSTNKTTTCTRVEE